MEKKYVNQMEGASRRRKQYLAVLFRGLERIFMVPENRAKRLKDDPDFRSKSVSIWVEEIKAKRAKYDFRNFLETDFGRYSSSFVPKDRRFGRW